MLGIKWKYIIILGLFAGIIYFMVSLFSIGTLEAIDGNPLAYLLLFFTWIGLIIAVRTVESRIKVKDLPKLLVLGMILHIYFCLFYFLNKISYLFALASLPILIISLYGWHNRQGLIDKLSIFKFYLPHSAPGHPYIYDKEYKVYVFRTWSGWEALKYLELKGDNDPIELLTIFYKNKIELSFEIHYFKDTLKFYCGILDSNRSYEKAVEGCKKKFYEIYNYLRYFGYFPSEIWDDYSMEQILEAPYLIWDPIEPLKLKKNPSPDDEQVIVECGMKKTKFSVYQFGKTPSKTESMVHLQRPFLKRIKTPSKKGGNVENNADKGMLNFLNRIHTQDVSNEHFLFIFRLHPFREEELNKEKRHVKTNLNQLVNHFKMDLVNNEANFKMLQLNSSLGGQHEKQPNKNILNLLYPDETQNLEELYQALDNYQLGEEIGYWRISTYFLGKKYLANIMAADLNVELYPLPMVNFQHVVRRKIFGTTEHIDSSGLINYFPFQPPSTNIDEKLSNIEMQNHNK